MICRQFLPMLLRERSTRVILFMASSDSTSSVHYSPKPLFLSATTLRHLIYTILPRNSLREFLLNSYFSPLLPSL